jgi:excinuclease ABC subunit C
MEIQDIRRYYLMGVVGVGKSTLLARLATRAGIEVSAEWLDETPDDLLDTPDSLPKARREALQDWIFVQVAKKNQQLWDEVTPTVQVVDRSPLDTFAFYPRGQWPHRARQLQDALSVREPQRPLAPGVVLLLQGDVAEIAARMDPARGYGEAKLAQQQAGFDELAAALEARGATVTRIAVAGLNPSAVEKAVVAGINAAYQPVDMQAFVDGLLAGMDPRSKPGAGSALTPVSAQAELSRRLARVPRSPGVYLWKDAAGRVLYVGKSRSLRNRMRQYLSGQDGRAQIPLLMAEVRDFEYLVTDSEHEALVLEISLIKQLTPPFNVDLRDDKSYPYLALTLDAAYPAIKYTREKHRPGTRYFGPYTDARGARETVDTLRRVIPVCRATCPEYKRVAAKGFAAEASLKRPCFDAQIGLGTGVCTGQISREDYAVYVRRAAELLEGRVTSLEADLRDQMEAAASDLNYELAARLRNRLDALGSIRKRQILVSDTAASFDVVGFAREENIATAYLLIVREGKVLYGNELTVSVGLGIAPGELVAQFLGQYYAGAGQIPREIVTEAQPEDRELLAEFLRCRRSELSESVHPSGRVHITVPLRGLKRRLLEMAERNARHALLRWKVRTHYDDERLNRALLELESALALDGPPLRIESYDISTLHGTNSVGSMVVFGNGLADKSAYRRFKIRGEFSEANDVAMMREVLGRRFALTRTTDERFARKPDLLLIDGGKPQLHATLDILAELGVKGVAVAGLAKREEELWTAWSDGPVVLADGSPALYLVKRIRDEAHRFAIEYHRKLRSKAMTASVLDEVVGIGPVRRRALIKHFGGMRRLREADEGQIAAAPGITPQIAADIYGILHLPS